MKVRMLGTACGAGGLRVRARVGHGLRTGRSAGKGACWARHCGWWLFAGAGTACGAGCLRVQVRTVHGLRSGLRLRARERARARHGIAVCGGGARAVHGLRSALRIRARERARARHGIAVGSLRRWGACCARHRGVVLRVRVVCVYGRVLGTASGAGGLQVRSRVGQPGGHQQ